MQGRIKVLLVALVCTSAVACTVGAQTQASPAKTLPKKPGATSGTQSGKPSKAATAPKAKAAPRDNPADDSQPAGPDNAQSLTPDADTELQIAVQQAGNDDASLIRNLEGYLAGHPDSPRRAAIFHALLQSEIRVRNNKRALEYAEQLLAMQPEDSETMYLTVTLLEKLPDEASQLRAIQYSTKLIDRVGSANPEARPQQMTLEDWQAGRNKFTMNLYELRGRTQRHLHKPEEAVKDLTESFRLLPNAAAALNLGEIAEERKLSDEAVRQYALAFILADQTQEENAVNRDEVRLKMGNVWRMSHGSNAGLGDVILGAYDKSKLVRMADRANVHNQGVGDPMQFTLRRTDGKSPLKLSELHGKTIVLNFWTTWCSYCRTVDPLLSDTRRKFAGRNDVVFLSLNADEEESQVTAYLQEQKVEGTLLYADGLDSNLKIESLPAVVVIDRAGKIAYREQGYAPDGFADALSAAITKAAAGQ